MQDGEKAGPGGGGPEDGEVEQEENLVVKAEEDFFHAIEQERKMREKREVERQKATVATEDVTAGVCFDLLISIP